MGQKKKITEADKIAFRTHLVNFLNMQEDTRQASIAADTAERRKQEVYALERKQHEAVIELWEKLREHEWMTFEHFKLPDGRLVKVEKGNIHVCPATQL